MRKLEIISDSPKKGFKISPKELSEIVDKFSKGKNLFAELDFIEEKGGIFLKKYNSFV